MLLLPSHFAAAYGIDLILGDPRWMPHPVRWIGRLISWMEGIFYDKNASHRLQRMAGCAFWMSVITVVLSGSKALIGIVGNLHPIMGEAVLIWLAYTTLATRSLHKESASVARALREKNLAAARERLSLIVSRDTSCLDESGIVRGMVETVSENISDGIVAPLFYLALGGPVAAIVYKAVNTMDSMVGYESERYRYFGWFAARMDDLVNWLPARLTGVLLVGAAACMKLNWAWAWRVMLRDGRKMKSPNAGFPEAAAAGALNVQLGGVNVYFGQSVEKPTLGEAGRPLTLDVYRQMIRLMYVTSFLAFALTFGLRVLNLTL